MFIFRTCNDFDDYNDGDPSIDLLRYAIFKTALLPYGYKK